MFIGILLFRIEEARSTRIWDAGYNERRACMKSDEMELKPHPIPDSHCLFRERNRKVPPIPLGNLDFKPQILKIIREARVPQLANEYGWICSGVTVSPANLP